MAQTYYRPRPKKQLTGSALGSKNCNMSAAAVLADRDTLGVVDVTADAMRKASGDTVGGTGQDGAVTALSKYGITVDAFDYLDGKGWVDVVAFLKSGREISASGVYGEVPLALRGDKDFTGTHQVYFNEIRASDGALLAFDGLDDGRRPGIPKAPIWWPAAVARDFMAALPGAGFTFLVGRKRRATAKVAVANVRASASTSSATIAQLTRGQSLARGSKAVIGGAVGTNRVWYPVWVPGKAIVGYMHSSVVTL